MDAHVPNPIGMEAWKHFQTSRFFEAPNLLQYKIYAQIGRHRSEWGFTPSLPEGYRINQPSENIFVLPMSEPKSAKEITLELVEKLDDDVTFEEIMYELHVLQKINRGRRDAQEGQVIPHEEVQDRLSQWLT